MKKLLVLVTAFLFLLVGCGKMDTPTQVVENYLNNYKKNDDSIVSKIDISKVDSSVVSDEQSSKYVNIIKRQYKDLTYKINSEKIDGNKAVVDVSIEVYDYKESIRSSNQYLDEHKDEFYNEEILDVDSFIDYKIKELEGYNNRTTYNIVFNLERADSKSEWIIKDLSEEDLLKIHGIYEN